MRKKFLPKLVIASLLVGGVNFVPAVVNFDAENLQIVSVASAEVKMYVGVSEDYANQIENQEVAKLRAKDKAVKKAVEQAGIYLKSYTKTVNAVLTDDEISVIASNTYEIVGDVKYERTINQISDETTVIVWKATVNVNVDDSEVKNWIRLDDNKKSTIVEQNNNIKIASAENERQVEDLRKRAANAKTDAEKLQLKTEFDKVDNEFLAIQKFEEGNKFYYRRQFTQAVEALNESLKYNSQNTEALLRLGFIYQSDLTDKDKAFEYFKKIVEIDENHISAWASLGTIYRFNFHNEQKGLECYNKSIEAGNKLLAENPNNLKVLWGLGSSYSILEDNKKALECYQKAVELEPNNKTAWHLFGNFYSSSLKNYNKAIEFYNKSLEIDSNYIPAWLSLGITYTHYVKDYNKALECYNKVVEIDSNHVIAYNFIAGVYKDMKNSAKAFEYYQKAVEIAPEDSYAWTNLGDFYKDSKKNIFKAVDCYQKALEIAPKDASMWHKLGYLYQDLENYDGAIECYTKVIEISPKSGNDYILRGLCYQAIGDKAKAKEDFAKAKELGFKV